jgi:RNA polymerase sigma-70 factor (ECF subfamily)
VDADEFDRFYATCSPRLVGQLTAMLGSHAEAQDCVQEAFVKAWQQHRSLDADGSPEAWVRRTAWRVGVSRWRRAASVMRAYGRSGVGAEAVAAPSEDHAGLVEALRGINADQRRAIVLHHLCDRSVEDVARETGSPVGTVKARLARGRAVLAELLRDEAPSADHNDHGEIRHV